MRQSELSLQPLWTSSGEGSGTTHGSLRWCWEAPNQACSWLDTRETWAWLQGRSERVLYRRSPIFYASKYVQSFTSQWDTFWIRSIFSTTTSIQLKKAYIIAIMMYLYSHKNLQKFPLRFELRKNRRKLTQMSRLNHSMGHQLHYKIVTFWLQRGSGSALCPTKTLQNADLASLLNFFWEIRLSNHPWIWALWKAAMHGYVYKAQLHFKRLV